MDGERWNGRNALVYSPPIGNHLQDNIKWQLIRANPALRSSGKNLVIVCL